MTPDEQAIRTRVDTWFRATTAGDLSAVLALMADDVVFLGPGRPPMRKETAEVRVSARVSTRFGGPAGSLVLAIVPDLH